MHETRLMTLFIMALLLLSPFPLSSAGNVAGDATPIAVLDRIEEDRAVIVFEDGSCFVLPASLLPIPANEGECLRLTITKDETMRDSLEKAVASDILAMPGAQR